MKYERVELDRGVRHLWSVVSDCGRFAAHLWIEERPGREWYTIGGIEYHSAVAPEWRAGEDPGRFECWLLGKPCYHEGSSLQAEPWIRNFNEGGAEYVTGSVGNTLRERIKDMARAHAKKIGGDA